MEPDQMQAFLKRAARKVLVPLLYRYPPYGLKEERLALFLNEVLRLEGTNGSIAEVGCNLAGTSIIARKLQRNIGCTGDYFCFDTFGGFIEEQFEADAKTGTERSKRHLFSANSKALVQKILKRHQCDDIHLVEGDATKLSAEQMRQFSIVLVDVDLSEPTYEIMSAFWPYLAPGGVMISDDCYDNQDWQAKVGVERFCAEHALVPEYKHKLGFVRKPL
jgi:O-methyltransferase